MGFAIALPAHIRSAAVYRFKHCVLLAHIRAGNDAQPADQARGQVRHDIAVEVRQQQISKVSGRMTSCMEALSTISSLY